MPIVTNQPINPLSAQEFYHLDSRIMGLAFDTHNQLGRFYDEKIYQNELLRACRAGGLHAETEVLVELTHKTFLKSLYIDLLVERSVVYELKTASAITAAHRVQTLDYLFLTGTKHGKIINFRPPSIEHEFSSTTLDTAKRKAFSVCDKNWNPLSDTAFKLKSLLIDLLNDWGAWLNTELYKEAICHFFGGLEAVIQPVEIKNHGILLGTQKVPLLSKTESLCISSVTKAIPVYRTHLQRFLSHTDLETVYWINLNHSEIQFTTLNNPRAEQSLCP